MAQFDGYLIQVSSLEEATSSSSLTAPAWSVSTTVYTPAVEFDQSLTAPAIAATTQVPTPEVSLGVSASIVTNPTTVPTPMIGFAGAVSAPFIASTAAVPTPIAAGPLIASSVGPSTSVPQPVVAGPVVAPLIAPSSQVFNPVAAGPVTTPAWPASTNIPTPQIGAFLFPVVVPSTSQVFSPLIALTQVVSPTLVPAATQIFTPTAGVVVDAPSVASTTAVFAPELVGPLLAPLVDNPTQVFTPDIRRIIEFSLDVTSGSTAGGNDLILLGSALDMSDCTPTYTDGSLDTGFWTDISTNSGEVTEVNATSSFQLNTGVTPNSIAGIRTIEPASNVDVEIQATSLVADPIIESAAELALYVNSGTDCRLIVASGRITLRVRENGQTSFDQAIALTAGRPQLRLLRVDSVVYVFLGGQLVTRAFWVNTNCQIEIKTVNNVVRASQSALRVSQYQRRPVVLFDQTPVTDIDVVSRDQALATAPSRKFPGVVDVALTGCSTVSDTIPSAYTYFLNPDLSRVFNIPSGPRMTAISDPAVTGRVGRSL